MDCVPISIEKKKLIQSQVSGIVYEKASSEQGFRELIALLLNSLLKHERIVWQEKHEESANGFHFRRVNFRGIKFVLQILRTRFYPTLLAYLRDEE